MFVVIFTLIVIIVKYILYMRMFTRGKTTGKYLFYENRQSSFIIRCNINNLVQVIWESNIFLLYKKNTKISTKNNQFFYFQNTR